MKPEITLNGDEVVDLHVPEHLRAARVEEAMTLPNVLVTDLDLNGLQTFGEGWASPLKGFMREGALIEVLHFNSVLVDPFNLTADHPDGEVSVRKLGVIMHVI